MTPVEQEHPFHAAPDARRLARAGGELALAVPCAALLSLAIQHLVDQISIPTPSFAPTAFSSLACAFLLLFSLYLMMRAHWHPVATPIAWAVLSGLATLPLTFLLFGSRFYMFGIGGDQFFRTQFLVRLTDSATLSDGNYAGLPAYYPVGWFWFGGRFASLAGMPGWEAYKPFAILTMAVAPVIAFVTWSLLIRRSLAFLLAVLTCIAGLRVAAYEPYSWLVGASMVPMAVLTWLSFAALTRQGWRAALPGLTAVGVYFGICGAVYTLLFVFFAAVIAGVAAAAVFDADRRVSGSPGRSLRRVVFGGAIIGGIALPIVLLSWGSYLIRLWTAPAGPSVATRFLPEIGAKLPTPMFEPTVSGVLCLAGLLSIGALWRRSQISRVLGLVVAACYLWFLLSFGAVAFRFTLLAFRLDPVLITALFCAAGLGAPNLIRALHRRWLHHRAELRLATVVIAFLVSVNLVQTVREAEDQTIAVGVFEAAQKQYNDTGRTALGTRHPEDDGAWNGDLLATISTMTQAEPSDLVVLTTNYSLLAFRPYHGFQTNDNAYANPLARFDERRGLVESWSKSSGPAELSQALDRSPEIKPSLFVLRRVTNGLAITLSFDNFPAEVNNEPYQVVFPERLFDDPRFERRDVGPFAVIARRW